MQDKGRVDPPKTTQFIPLPVTRICGIEKEDVFVLAQKLLIDGSDAIF